MSTMPQSKKPRELNEEFVSDQSLTEPNNFPDWSEILKLTLSHQCLKNIIFSEEFM